MRAAQGDAGRAVLALLLLEVPGLTLSNTHEALLQELWEPHSIYTCCCRLLPQQKDVVNIFS